MQLKFVNKLLLIFSVCIVMSLSSCSASEACENYYWVELVELKRNVWICTEEGEPVDVSGTAQFDVHSISKYSGDIAVKGKGTVNVGETQIVIKDDGSVLINGVSMSTHINTVVDIHNKVILGAFLRDFE